jgi:hypothetical protein
MSYTPHTVWVGVQPKAPRPIKAKYIKGKAGYVNYENSPVAQRMMALICQNPGAAATELVAVTRNRISYGYLDCLRRDGYADVRVERKAKGMAVMHVWPTELFLAKFPPTL